MPEDDERGLQLLPGMELRMLFQVSPAVCVDGMEMGQDLIGDRQIGAPIQTAADDIPVLVVQAEQGFDIVGKLDVPPHREEEPVHQKNDEHGGAQVCQTQGDRQLLVHGHGGHGQGVAGGEDRLVPGAGGGAVHQAGHDDRKGQLPFQRRQERIGQEHDAAGQERADRAGLHAVAAVLIAGLQEQERI